VLPTTRLVADAFQNAGRTPGEFASRNAVLVSVTDIAGFLGGRPGSAAWRVDVVSAAVDGAAADDGHSPESAGEAMLIAALVEGEGTADEAARALLLETMQRPDDPTPVFWLAMARLWQAAESDRSDPRSLETAVLADHWFRRYEQLGGADPRLPSWTVPLRMSLARWSTDPDAAAGLYDRLREAADEDVGFHGFALGLLGHRAPVGSPRFTVGLEAIRATLASDGDDPSVQNRPRWPHNREGFLLFAADYERRAGRTERALELLDRIESEPGAAGWRFLDEVAERRARWRRDPSHGDVGPSIWDGPTSCVVCHRR
jgi:hypothetical protein